MKSGILILILILNLSLVSSKTRTSVPFESQVSFIVKGTSQVIQEVLVPLNKGKGEFRRLRVRNQGNTQFDIRISYFDNELLLINEFVNKLNKNSAVSHLEVKLYLSSEITNNLLMIEEIQILRNFSKKYYVYFDKEIWVWDE